MPAVSGGRKGRGTRAAPAPAPRRPAAKLNGAASVGLSPMAALNVAGATIVIGLFLVLLTGPRAAAGVAAVGDSLDRRLAGAGFRVESIHLLGASEQGRGPILGAAGVVVGDPILGLDLDAVRARLEASGWVKSAKVSRLLPGTLAISVVESHQIAVWQHGATVRVIDQNGHVLEGADPGAFPDLPLVVGAGADEAAGEIVPLITELPRLTERLEALVRVDQRRWDLRLKDGGLIQLPAVGEDSALLRLDQLDGRSRLLELGFARVDLRDPQAVVVRPKAASAPLTLAESIVAQ